MIRIGTRISPDWLERPNDLWFLKQIGVDYVDITLDMVAGYREHGGRIERPALERVIEKLGSCGLQIERANFLNSELHPIYLGGPEADQILDNVVHTAGVLGEAKIPVMGMQCFQASRLLGGSAGERTWQQGRGGYEYLHIDLREAMQTRARPEAAPSRESLWDRTLDIYRAVMPVAEKTGLRVAMHGNDPPVPSLRGIPQILYSKSSFDHLFSEVPSPNNGVTFCVGTRYESGEDVFDMIRHFGQAGRLFHVHFRNVVGTIPISGGYSEVAPDEGDLNMAAVARALHNVGYDGVIDYDHIMRLVDDPAGKSYIAYCVGYMRGILTAIQGPGA